MKTRECCNCGGTMSLGPGGWVCLACDAFEPTGDTAKLAAFITAGYPARRAALLLDIRRACDGPEPEPRIIGLAADLAELAERRDDATARLNDAETLSRRAAEQATARNV